MNCLENIGEVYKIKPSATSYIWKITNYNAFELITGHFLTSPMILTDHHDIKLRMILFPRGCNEETESDDLGLFLQLFSSDQSIKEITANVRFSLLNAKYETVVKLKLSEGKYKLLPETEYQNPSLPKAAGRKNFTSRSFIMNENNEVFQNNVLRFRCELTSYDPIFTTLIQKELSDERFRLREFDNFQKLLDNETFSDVQFNLGDKKIRAHKIVLVSRSSVFRAMFDEDTKENQRKSVDIVDIKFDVMKELLRFVYAATVKNIEGMACDLLLAAEKYCIAGLKLLCEETLYRDLNVDNALKHLTVAHTCNAVFLKTQAIEFIVNNASEVIEREEFAALNADLMCEITRGIVRDKASQ